MPELGPLWQIAEFNAYYYASFWIAPCLIGIGAVSVRTKTFCCMMVAAVLATFALTWFAHEQMWAMRATIVINPAEQLVLDLHAKNSIRYSILYATGQTLRITVVWGFGGVAFRAVRKWFHTSQQDANELPFETMN